MLAWRPIVQAGCEANRTVTRRVRRGREGRCPGVHGAVGREEGLRRRDIGRVRRAGILDREVDSLADRQGVLVLIAHTGRQVRRIGRTIFVRLSATESLVQLMHVVSGTVQGT